MHCMLCMFGTEGYTPKGTSACAPGRAPLTKSRLSMERGATGLKTITDAHPDAAKSIELVNIDVGDDASVKAAAESLKAKGVTLYALVNNAGLGFRTGGLDGKDKEVLDQMINVNFFGPKRVSDAFLPLIDPKGRIVNVSSGAASMWLRNQSAEMKKLFCSPDTTWEQLSKTVVEEAAKIPAEKGGGYGPSKAGLTAYTLQQAKAHPSMVITSLSPGFIETKMTSGFGAKLTPEQGTVSYIKCLFEEVLTGQYYGSDGLRSPMTVTRDPGTPEYQGEEEPDAAKYNK